MGFNKNLQRAMGADFEAFKLFISQSIQLRPAILSHFLLMESGQQQTLLNLLIESHQKDSEASKDYTQWIAYLLEQGINPDLGEPLHLALALGKKDLFYQLLDESESAILTREQLDQLLNRLQFSAKTAHEKIMRYRFNLNARDAKGKTLLYGVLNTQDVSLLAALLSQGPNVNIPNWMPKIKCMYQPLHQSIFLNFSNGVRMLAASGAQLSNPVGSLADTPLTLAARLLKTDALEALLESPIESLMIEKPNRNELNERFSGHTAVEEFCRHIADNNNLPKAIKGVAMLLCRGAEPPRNEVMRGLLVTHRWMLLKAIQSYLADKPELVDAFVQRCHLSNTSLHKIIYADNTWGNSVRRFFGVASDEGFMLEQLVYRKYSKIEHGERNSLKLYAFFVQKYQEAYRSQRIANPWSEMRWQIAEGTADWESVKRYAKSKPLSRTAMLYRDMVVPLPEVNDESGSPDEMSSVSRANQ